MTTTMPATPHGSNDRLKFYQDLVETSQDLIFQCDVQGRFTFLNPAWEAATGYTIEELLGRKFTDFIAPGMLEGTVREFARVILGGSFNGHETAFTGKKQELIYLNFNAKVVRDEKGGVIGAQGTAYDITRFKLAEQRLLESEERFSKAFLTLHPPHWAFLRLEISVRDCRRQR
jgi:PAS domain S-box-containing protein